MIVNSIKGRTHITNPEMELEDGTTIELTRMTEDIIEAALHIQNNINFIDSENATKDDILTFYERLNEVYKMLIIKDEDYKKLIEYTNQLNLQDRLTVMNVMLATAKFEEYKEAAEGAADGSK